MEELRLDIGCGEAKRPGYIGLDCYPGAQVDVVVNCFGHNTKKGVCYPEGWELPDFSAHFQPGTVDAIHTHHVIEHIPWKVAPFVIAKWCELLKPGGEVIFACPDLEYLCRAYVNKSGWDIRYPHEHGNILPATFGNYLDEGYGEPATHKGGFDFTLISRYLQDAGVQDILRIRASRWQQYADWELAVQGVKA